MFSLETQLFNKLVVLHSVTDVFFYFSIKVNNIAMNRKFLPYLLLLKFYLKFRLYYIVIVTVLHCRLSFYFSVCHFYCLAVYFIICQLLRSFALRQLFYFFIYIIILVGFHCERIDN